MLNDKIVARDIKDWAYCPRIVFYKNVLKLLKYETTKTIEGKEKEFIFKRQTTRSKIVKKYTLPLFKKYNLNLETEEFATKVDCIAIDKENNLAFPIQLKCSFKPNKTYETQRLQLLFEAMLIEKIFGFSSPAGYIKYSKSNEIVKINLLDRTRLFGVINKIKEIISKEKFPDATNYKKRCADCFYRRLCYG